MTPSKTPGIADQKPPSTLTTPPPSHAGHVILSFPLPRVMLVTFNRPKAMNAVDVAMRLDLQDIFNWFEREPDLWVAIVTGTGPVAFSAGADLRAWKDNRTAGIRDQVRQLLENPAGFGSLSRRISNKIIIAAVNGVCLGGGLEVVVNCDLVIASEKARFGFPEPKVGVVVAAGAIPRLMRISGHQKAAELLLTGDTISAEVARDRFGFVNEVVPHDRVISRVLEYAQKVISLSPDAVRATKRAINESNLHGSIEEAWKAATVSSESYAAYSGENITEGLKAFSERRKPRWTNPKL